MAGTRQLRKRNYLNITISCLLNHAASQSGRGSVTAIRSFACDRKASPPALVRGRGQTLPTVFNRALGWISACDNTMVCDLKRSTSERTNGRIAAEVTKTGA